jgi:GT2 family glycosyltransferase
MSELFSIIIPNWNGKHHLETCLNALRQQTYSPIEIILSDNASTDGSREYVAEHFPEVRILAHPRNLGFTGACNAGLTAAKGAVLALLNNDTEVDGNWVAEVVAAFGRHPGAGAIASRMMLFDKRDHFHTAGDLYRVDGIPVNRGVWQPNHGQYDDEIQVFSACGGSSAYRREALDQVGLLDDDFFFSCEDVDLGWRLNLGGWTCYYAPKAVVYHKLKASSDSSGVIGSFYDGRNFIYVIVKNYPRALLRKYGGAILRAQGRLAWDAIRAWRGRAARARLRGMAAGIINIPRLLIRRRRIQASRRVSIKEIEFILAAGKG